MKWTLVQSAPWYSLLPNVRVTCYLAPGPLSSPYMECAITVLQPLRDHHVYSRLYQRKSTNMGTRTDRRCRFTEEPMLQAIVAFIPWEIKSTIVSAGISLRLRWRAPHYSDLLSRIPITITLPDPVQVWWGKEVAGNKKQWDTGNHNPRNTENRSALDATTPRSHFTGFSQPNRSKGGLGGGGLIRGFVDGTCVPSRRRAGRAGYST